MDKKRKPQGLNKARLPSSTDKAIKFIRSNPKLVAGYTLAIAAVGIGIAALSNKRRERERRKRHGLSPNGLASTMHRWS
jgi:hypothetical protein